MKSKPSMATAAKSAKPVASERSAPTVHTISATAGLIKKYYRPYWHQMAVVLILNIVSSLCNTVRPLLFAPAFELFADRTVPAAEDLASLTLNNLGPTLLRVLGQDGSDLMETGIVIASLFLGLSLFIACVNSVSIYYSAIVNTATLRDLIIALHRHLILLPIPFFHSRSAGELLSRITHDARQTVSHVSALITGFLKSLVQLTLTAYMLLVTNVMFTLLILLMGGMHYVITRFFGKRIRRLNRQTNDLSSELSVGLLDSFSGIRIIKVLAAERHDARKIREAAGKLRNSAYQLRMTSQMQMPIRFITDAALTCTVILLAFYGVTSSALTLVGAAMFFYLAQRLVGPLSVLFVQLTKVQGVVGSSERILEILAEKNKLVDGDQEIHSFESNIRIRGVSFAYGKQQNVLEDIDLEIRKGEFVAFVGPSGAGKSTLFDLILRLHDPAGGCIEYDGVDIREFRQRVYRKYFGVVSQECLLFNGNVKENILFGRKLDQAKLDEALHIANARDFIANLPQDVDTLVGDRGIILSGGQRQRIAIARAVYSCPNILLLDEATSALDSDNEKEVQRAINSLPEDMTVIAIAHRISTIIHADKVVVMDNGRVQAVGTHTELLKSSELYRRLAQSYVETDFTGSPGDEEAEQRNSVTPLMED